jgi:nucleotide-binding universal stress UspA family protein
MKKILVPCDFSKPAIEAYKFAINIASKTNGEVFVLHVINIPIITDAAMMGGAYDSLMIIGIEEEAKKQFEKMKAAWGGNNIPSSIRISTGYTQTVIMSSIESLSIDLVIMGTSGASGIYEIFVGSTTEKVVRHSPVPVLALRTASDPQSIRRILLPTSLSFEETNFISKVKELVNFFNASLQILLINTPIHFKGDKESKSFLKEFAEHHKLENYCIYVRNAYTEEEGIRNFAEEQKSDLIVMSTHARKGLSHFFNGSITEDVVNHIACPVWTFAIEK